MEGDLGYVGIAAQLQYPPQETVHFTSYKKEMTLAVSTLVF